MFRFIGAVLLVIGTTVGAGLLALPMVTVKAGLLTSIFFMLVMCCYMTIPAFFIMHVMLSQPKGAHLVTMAKATLGPWGVLVLWLSNCILLYSILAAYISAGGDLVSNYLVRLTAPMPIQVGSIIFTGVMALFVIPGIRVTGLANTVFMALKAVLYFLLVGVLFTHIKPHFEFVENVIELRRTVLVGVASFSYAMIIPSVYAYLNFDIKRLKRVIITGTIISFVIYILWLISVRVVIPLNGEEGLLALAKHGSVYFLAKSIGHFTRFAQARVIANSFVSVCLLTTFLGVSLCLSDVIADGLKLRKKGWQGFVVYLLTYAPPVICVLFFPQIFIIGVNYAGLNCLVYLAILPTLMIYSARYYKKILPDQYRSPLNSHFSVLLILLIAVFLFGVGLYNIIHSS